MGLAREGGQQHPQAVGLARLGHAGDGDAQHDLHRLGVQVLFEDLELAAHPGVADGRVERDDDLGHEARHPHPRQQPRELAAQQVHVVGADVVEVGTQVVQSQRRCGAAQRLVDGLAGELLQLRQRQRHDATRPVPAIEQPLDDAQLVYFGQRVGAFADAVAGGRGEAVAPLPDAQCVLAQARIALDGGDRQG